MVRGYQSANDRVGERFRNRLRQPLRGGTVRAPRWGSPGAQGASAGAAGPVMRAIGGDDA